jgi:DNA-directed RNA polymerase beta' subunit
VVGGNSIVGTEPNFGRGLVRMYKKANRFMIGSRRGSGYSVRATSSGPKKAAAKLHKKTIAIAREYQKIMVKKKANELRILKEQQRVIAENALREAIIEHKRLRIGAGSKKAKINSSKRSASRKKLAVAIRRSGDQVAHGLRTQKAKPAPQ